VPVARPKPDALPDREGLWSAVADPTRRALLDRLRAGPTAATELGQGLSMSKPAISQHLGVLLDAGLVARERRGRSQVYSLSAEGLKPVADWVREFERFWDDRLARLGAYLNRKAQEGVVDRPQETPDEPA